MRSYKYNHVLTYIKGVLEYKYFEAAAGDMKELLNTTANELTGFRANVAIIRTNVNTVSLEAVALISTETAAEITMNEDTQEEANHQSVF